MQPGDKVRLIGSAGAPFVTTVGQPFSEAEIQRRLDSGEWTRPGDEPQPTPEPDTEDAPETEQQAAAGPEQAAPQGKTDPDRPAVNAPKAEWVAYVARTQHMSREDAANYTKADLIDMVS